MLFNELKVGTVIFCSGRNTRDRRENREYNKGDWIVIKVGRKYAYVCKAGNEDLPWTHEKINTEGKGILEFFMSENEYKEKLVREKIETKLRELLQFHNVAKLDNISFSDITQAATLLGINYED